MGKSSKPVTVGYKYYLGLHFGFCQGPVDSVLEIQVGERTAWTGSQTSSGSISISQPNLFGGESREGGIVGTVDVMMGEDAQTANSYLTTQQGSPQPGYRGILGMVYKAGLIACNNPYVKPWAVKVRRITSGWSGGTAWYSAKASVTTGSVTSANPAHIVYECLTNPEWGMGYPSAQLDDTVFRAAADTFYAEGLGLCIQWAKQDSIQNFVQQVVDHAGAVLAQDPSTGLFLLKPIRDDYSIGTRPRFGDQDGNVVRVDRIERSSYTETVNEIILTYVDAATGKDATVRAQNLASIQSQGGVISQTRSYPGIPTSALANRTAVRDLKAASSGIARVSFVATRAAYSLAPGDVIRFQWLAMGLQQMALRIIKIDYGTLTDGEIKIEAVEDVYSLPSTVYVADVPAGWTEPSYAPVAATYYTNMEATFRDLVIALGQNDAETTGSTAGYMIAMAGRPSGVSYNYALETTTAAPNGYVRYGNGDWCPTGTLASSIGPSAETITVSGFTDFEDLKTGTVLMIGTGSTAEIVSIGVINTATLTLTVGRGCVDTVPKTWAAGTRVWAYELHGISDNVDYVQSETVSARFITVSPTGELAAGSAPVAAVTMNRRQTRAYPPGHFRLNTAWYPTTIAGQLVVSWIHRDRVLQSDTIVETKGGGTGPEAGTTYSLNIYGEFATNLISVTGQTGLSYTYSTEAAVRSTLLHLDGADNSTTFTDQNGKTFSAVGTAKLSTAQKKFGTASLLLDGATGAITTPATTQLDLYTSFTIELWVYASSTGNTGDRVLFMVNTANGVVIKLQDLKLALAPSGGSNHAISTNTIPTDQWVHVAVSRSGSTTRLFINGVQDGGYGSTFGYIHTGVVSIGGTSAGASCLNGYIDEVAVYSLAAKFTANFTPRATAYPTHLNETIRVELWSVKGGLDSWQRHDWTTTRTA